MFHVNVLKPEELHEMFASFINYIIVHRLWMTRHLSVYLHLFFYLLLMLGGSLSFLF